MKIRVIKTPAGAVGILDRDMRTRAEIEAEIAALESSEILSSPQTGIFAVQGKLIQISMQARIDALRWVLKQEAK